MEGLCHRLLSVTFGFLGTAPHLLHLPQNSHIVIYKTKIIYTSYLVFLKVGILRIFSESLLSGASDFADKGKEFACIGVGRSAHAAAVCYEERRLSGRNFHAQIYLVDHGRSIIGRRRRMRNPGLLRGSGETD